MKYLSSFLVLLFVISSLNAQEEADFPTSRLFKVQLGYRHHYTFQSAFGGVNILSLGTNKFKTAHKLSGVDLSIFAYQYLDGPRLFPGIKSNVFINNHWYKSYAVFGKPKNGIYFGPMLSTGFIRQKYIPVTKYGNELYTTGFNLGFGFKVDYFLRISERILLTFSSKYTVVEWTYKVEVEQKASLSSYTREQSIASTFLRSQLPILIGLTFPLSRKGTK